MALPTSGFTTTKVTYYVSIDSSLGGIYLPTIEVSYEQNMVQTESELEDIITLVESTVQTLADTFDADPSVSGVAIFKHTYGVINHGDVRS